MDEPQDGDAEKAAEFAAMIDPIKCRLCGHPMQGKHKQCVNVKCVWLGTTAADQAAGSLKAPSDGDSNG